MKKENEYCSVCQGRLKQKKITYTQSIGEKVYIIKNVSAKVCPQCGEEYLSPATVDAIASVIATGKAPYTIQVPVYNLAQSV